MSIDLITSDLSVVQVDNYAIGAFYPVSFFCLPSLKDQIVELFTYVLEVLPRKIVGVHRMYVCAESCLYGTNFLYRPVPSIAIFKFIFHILLFSFQETN